MQYENEYNETDCFEVNNVGTGVIIGYVEPDKVTFGELPYYAESIILLALSNEIEAIDLKIQDLILNKKSAKTVENWQSLNSELESMFLELLSFNTTLYAFNSHDGETSSFDYESFNEGYDDDGRYDYIKKSIEEIPPQF